MTVEENKVVTIDYAIKENDGTLLEDSADEPLSYIHGTGVLAPGLEKAMQGAEKGKTLSVELAPEEAFGSRKDELVLEVSREDFEDPQQVKPGLVFHAELDDEMRYYTVISVEDDAVVIDGNHPFADKTLTFEVTIREVREASAEELDHGHVHEEGHHHH